MGGALLTPWFVPSPPGTVPPSLCSKRRTPFSETSLRSACARPVPRAFLPGAGSRPGWLAGWQHGGLGSRPAELPDTWPGEPSLRPHTRWSSAQDSPPPTLPPPGKKWGRSEGTDVPSETGLGSATASTPGARRGAADSEGAAGKQWFAEAWCGGGPGPRPQRVPSKGAGASLQRTRKRSGPPGRGRRPAL